MKINFDSISKSELYEIFHLAPLSLSEKEIAIILELSRFDARLFEIVTEFLRDFWWALDPIYLNINCKKQKSPFVLKCIINAILEYCEIRHEDQKNFSSWSVLATQGIPLPPPQLLIISGYKIGGVLQKKQIQQVLSCFKKNNIFYADIPFNKGQAKYLKSENFLPENKISKVDLLKTQAILKIKNLSHKFSNEEIIKKLKINRVFLSNILNSKTNKISLDYLIRVTENI